MSIFNNVVGTVSNFLGRSTVRTGLGIAVPIIGAAALSSLISQKRNVYNTVGSESGTLLDERQQYYTNISVAEYKRDPTKLISASNLTVLNTFLKVATTFTKYGYKLPLPAKLLDKNSVRWESEPLINAEKGQQQLQEGVLGKAASQIANVKGATQALAGAVPNEFLTMLFKGPSYKKFTLQFLISPNTPAQSRAFRQMVVNFKNAMAPSLTAGNLLFAYPNVFKVSFHSSSGGTTPFLYEFKPAVLESFTVDYAPTGVPSFYVGTDEPESFVLNMDFCEIEFWLEGDFK
jgi:hypothetical protein